MIPGQGLTFLAVSLQSAGKVLYGTWLAGVSTAAFLLVSFCVTAAIFVVVARFRMPARGLGQIVLANLWSAVTFACFFFALKYLAPASVGSIEIGAAVIVAVVLAGMRTKVWPGWRRGVACAGIVGGCAVLALTELNDAPANGDAVLAGVALAASALAGIASTLAAVTFKKLANVGWSASSILAHRFYLTIVMAFVWLVASGQDVVPATETLPAVLAVAAIGVLLPLLLLQIALRRTDTLTVMICGASQPVISFAFALLSPVYDWSGAALTGVLVVSGALVLDIYAQRSRDVSIRPHLTVATPAA
ncbi:MAG TPA: hypothetical protein VGL08_19985 [Paraburkholderia sp.]|jgi:drug/metabolite transporter (DMT)-like permease